MYLFMIKHTFFKNKMDSIFHNMILSIMYNTIDKQLMINNSYIA